MLCACAIGSSLDASSGGLPSARWTTAAGSGTPSSSSAAQANFRRPLITPCWLADGQAHSGDAALLLGYGGGLSFAAQVITIP